MSLSPSTLSLHRFCGLEHDPYRVAVVVMTLAVISLSLVIVIVIVIVIIIIRWTEHRSGGSICCCCCCCCCFGRRLYISFAVVVVSTEAYVF